MERWEYGFLIYLQALILLVASLEGKWALFVFGINCYVIGISYCEALHFLTDSFASCFSAIQLPTRDSCVVYVTHQNEKRVKQRLVKV